MNRPPIPKYKFTVEIRANSHDEIERELHYLANGEYTDHTEGHTRDDFHVIGGRYAYQLEYANPDMTPDKYESALKEWRQEKDYP